MSYNCVHVCRKDIKQTASSSAFQQKLFFFKGRNGILQNQERQWVTSYRVSYSQDSDGGKWEYISDADGNPMVSAKNGLERCFVTVNVTTCRLKIKD